MSSVQFSSVARSCPTLCDPMNCSTPGLRVHHHLSEFTQTHVHPVGDAIQPSHLCHLLLLLPPIPPSIRVFSNESILRMRWPLCATRQCNRLPRWLSGKESTCQAGGAGLIHGLGRFLGGENDNPFQYSCLGNPMDNGTWQATIHGVAKSQT